MNARLHKIEFSFLFVMAVFLLTTSTSAVGPFTPNETQDPGCLPSEVTCYVEMPDTFWEAATTPGAIHYSGGNVGINTTTPTSTLDVTGSLNFTGAFTVSGNAGTVGQVLTSAGGGAPTWNNITNVVSFNQATQSLYSSTPILAASSGNSNDIFLGPFAGIGASGTHESVFIGNSAGYGAATANDSIFFGDHAGYNATLASNSQFIGEGAGWGASGADNSNFFGYYAGSGAINSRYSNFFGQSAGRDSNAYNSNFFGYYAGNSATGAQHSNFFGEYAGNAATNASYSNLFGYRAGALFIGNNIGSNNIIIGTNISLPNGTANAINIGGVLFGTNTQDNVLMGDPFITPQTSGKIGIATIPTTYTLEVGNSSVGGIIASFTNSANTCTIDTSLSCTSDERLKTNIEDLDDNTLDKLLDVRTVRFSWLKDPSAPEQIGFLAQDLKQYFPEIVSKGPNDYYQVNYAGMTPILTKAIQELDIRVSDISSLTEDSTFADTLRAWLANAGNRVTRIFTGEVCLSDEEGSTCLNRGELMQLKTLLGTQGDNTLVDDEIGEDVPETSEESMVLSGDTDGTAGEQAPEEGVSENIPTSQEEPATVSPVSAEEAAPAPEASVPADTV